MIRYCMKGLPGEALSSIDALDPGAFMHLDVHIAPQTKNLTINE